MPLTLSDADLVRLQGTMRTLLSPLDHADPDEWRERVVRSTKALLGADTVAFMLPLPGHVLLHTDADKRGATEEYEAYYGALDVGLRRKRLERKLEVYHGMYDVYDDLEELFGGEMYNDWGVRWGALDPVVMSTEIAADSAPAAIFGYHDQMTANPFGERGLDLLRLLLPAFQSGVHACLLLRTRREGLARALDSLGEGLLVCDLAGRTLHRNAALQHLLACDPEADRLLREMDRVARSLVRVEGSAANASTRDPAGVSREVRTGSARYRLRGSLVGPELLTPGVSVLVALERLTPEMPSVDALRARWGLTRQEANVASLLARGLSNEATARSLCISPHTARRHTERVLQKLGVNSRAEVGPRMLGG